MKKRKLVLTPLVEFDYQPILDMFFAASIDKTTTRSIIMCSPLENLDGFNCDRFKQILTERGYRVSKVSISMYPYSKDIYIDFLDTVENFIHRLQERIDSLTSNYSDTTYVVPFQYQLYDDLKYLTPSIFEHPEFIRSFSVDKNNNQVIYSLNYFDISDKKSEEDTKEIKKKSDSFHRAMIMRMTDSEYDYCVNNIDEIRNDIFKQYMTLESFEYNKDAHVVTAILS